MQVNVNLIGSGPFEVVRALNAVVGKMAAYHAACVESQWCNLLPEVRKTLKASRALLAAFEEAMVNRAVTVPVEESDIRAVVESYALWASWVGEGTEDHPYHYPAGHAYRVFLQRVLSNQVSREYLQHYGIPA